MVEEDHITAYAAHNAAFEAQCFTPALPPICTDKAALRIWPEAPGHANFALAYWLEDTGCLRLDRTHIGTAHRAGPDAYATAHILQALMAAGATIEQMIEWSQEPALMPTIRFGKHAGARWTDIPDGYLQWLLRTGDIDVDTQWNAQREIDRRNATAFQRSG
ncbi:hypothetical protein [Falsiruegeria mediterranea]|uniref:Exodeoxyribonuclease 10 n=1 Tax=Falsiruegeria mediterranea M17 TaxID=1200281 RepID=A0A2R8CGG4_9RHOB|nr:hypothetical protein [Falsiruegeria mediterranea]SPJ31486.1 Exodeoxyribonuclease 10 [Falsiruegeria mediterranea M17]